tara:strand:+ start:934 stop:2187 length:1254 start_codon:yes stop_codon:yes gene_type:complete
MFNFNKLKHKRNLSNYGKPSRDILTIFIEQVLLRAINFTTFTVVARQVDMVEMGSIGLAWTMLYFVEAFTSGSLSTVCIQHEISNRRTKSTYFWANCGFGLLGLYSLHALGAVGATFLDYLNFQKVATFIGLIYLVRMVGVAHKSSLIRDQEQSKLTMLTLISAVLSGVFGIYLAFMGLGIWAIIWRIGIESASITIMAICCNCWAPLICFSRSYFRDIVKRAYPLIGSRVTNLSIDSTRQVAVSATLGLEVLGGLEVARRLPFIVVQTGNVIMNRFSLPYFSARCRNQQNSHRIIYVSVLFGIFTSLLGLLSMFFFKEKIIEMVFGMRWVSYSNLFYYISIGSVAAIFTSYFNSVLIAYRFFKISLLQSAYLLASLPLFLFSLEHSIERAFFLVAIFQCACAVHAYFLFNQKLKPR